MQKIKAQFSPKVYVFETITGRSGGSFFQSLMDGHPQILMLPTCFNYLDVWNQFRSVTDIPEFLNRFTHHEGMAALFGFTSPICFIPQDRIIDYDGFCSLVTDYLADRQFNRANFFIAVHYAYAVLQNMALEKIHCVFFNHHNFIKAAPLIEDLKNVKFIDIACHPMANLKTARRFWRSRKNPYDPSLPWPYPLSPSYRFEVLDNTHWYWLKAREIRQHPDRFFVVQNEAMNNRPEETMLQVSAFIGIGFSDSLLKSTFCGRPWIGNNSNGLPNTFVPKPSPEGLYASTSLYEKSVVYAYLSRDMVCFGYNVVKPTNRLEKFIWQLLIFMPDLGETLACLRPGEIKWIWHHMPGKPCSARIKMIMFAVLYKQIRLIKSVLDRIMIFWELFWLRRIIKWVKYRLKSPYPLS